MVGSTSAPPPLKVSVTKSCAATGLGAVVESADQKEETCEIHDGRCKPETWLLASRVPVQRESAVRRAAESQVGSFSEGRVICCFWPWFLFKHLPAARKTISLSCNAAQEKLMKVRITVVFLDRCCPPPPSFPLLPGPSFVEGKESAPRVALCQALLLVICNVVFLL